MDILVAIDRLDDAALGARPVPLTDRVRLDPERLAADVAFLRSTWPAGAPDTLLYELEAIVGDAKRLPVTSKVSVDRERLHDVLDRMRAELPETVARTRIAALRRGLQHVSLEVRRGDVTAEVAFWALLGFDEVTPPGALAGQSCWVERGGTQIHLLLTDEPVVPPSGHAAVVAEDYEATLAALRATGFAPDPREEHWGAPRSFVRSPAGHRVEVMAAPPA